MSTNQDHKVVVTMTSSTGDIIHQVAAVDEGAASPQELVWKTSFIGDHIQKAFDKMADMALEGTKPPWE